MFCPKCGNEIPADTKFCPTCGGKIVKRPTAAKAQENSAPQKADSGKIVLIAVIVIAVVFVAALSVNKLKKGSDSETMNGENTERVETNGADTPKADTSKKDERGFSSYEDAIDALMTAALDKDVEAAVNCFPEEMEAYVKKLYNMYRISCENGWSGDALNYTNGMFFAFEALDPDFEYTYEIGEATEAEQSDFYYTFTRDELQTEYGLTADEAYVVQTGVTGECHYTDGGYAIIGPVKRYVEVAKIGKKWYIVQVSELWYSEWYL